MQAGGLPAAADWIQGGRLQLKAPFVAPGDTSVFHLELARPYRVIVSGEGARVEDSTGKRYLDAVSGGSMAASLGHGRRDLIEAVWEQTRRISYLDNKRLTSPWQEQLAAKLAKLAPPGFSNAWFVTGGSEANETMVRAARAYHLARGERQRWRIISPAQAYHGPTMAALSLTGRPGLQGAFGPYLSRHAHIPPSTRRFGPHRRRGPRRPRRGPGSRPVRRTSRLSSANRSAPPPCPPTRRPTASGRGWPSGGNSTGSWSASTRW